MAMISVAAVVILEVRWGARAEAMVVAEFIKAIMVMVAMVAILAVTRGM